MPLFCLTVEQTVSEIYLGPNVQDTLRKRKKVVRQRQPFHFISYESIYFDEGELKLISNENRNVCSKGFWVSIGIR